MIFFNSYFFEGKISNGHLLCDNNFSITRIDPAFYEDELFSILDQFENFLLVAGSNRKDIINDLMKNEKSYFMKENRSIFMI